MAANVQIPSNLQIYFGIVQDSIQTIDECQARDVRPKPGGSKGNIIQYDPKRASFKSAFIAIVFCGVFLEALFHVLIGHRVGLAAAKKLDNTIYETKATTLGIGDKGLLSDLTRFRKLRKEIVHEKAHFDEGGLWVAQKEARFAFSLIQNVQRNLGVDVQLDQFVK